MSCDAVILWLQPYSDLGEVDEISQVALPQELRTCERHVLADGSVCDVHHPIAHGLSLGWSEQTDERWTERVVILSCAPRAAYG
jgi:hypothetical protein